MDGYSEQDPSSCLSMDVVSCQLFKDSINKLSNRCWDAGHAPYIMYHCRFHYMSTQILWRDQLYFNDLVYIWHKHSNDTTDWLRNSCIGQKQGQHCHHYCRYLPYTHYSSNILGILQYLFLISHIGWPRTVCRMQ